MSSLVINGDTSGSVTLAAPAVAGSSTITLPTTGGTMRTTTTAGTLLQVVQATYQGEVTTTSGTFQTTNFSGTITPTSATSKILVQAVGEAKVQSGTTNLITFYRNGSNVVSQHLVQHSAAGDYVAVPIQYLDSPATISSISYVLQAAPTNAAGINWCNDGVTSTITVMEIHG